MTLALFDMNDGECETCGGKATSATYRAVPRFCSYWCHLVENGPDFFTLTTIAPWLRANRPPNKRIAHA